MSGVKMNFFLSLGFGRRCPPYAPLLEVDASLALRLLQAGTGPLHAQYAGLLARLGGPAPWRNARLVGAAVEGEAVARAGRQVKHGPALKCLRVAVVAQQRLFVHVEQPAEGCKLGAPHRKRKEVQPPALVKLRRNYAPR